MKLSLLINKYKFCLVIYITYIKSFNFIKLIILNFFNFII